MSDVPPDTFLVVIILSLFGAVVGFVAAMISEYLEKKGKDDE